MSIDFVTLLDLTKHDNCKNNDSIIIFVTGYNLTFLLNSENMSICSILLKQINNRTSFF